MKKLLTIAIIVLAYALAHAQQTTTNLIKYGETSTYYINGATNGFTVSASSATIPLRTFLINYGPITNANPGGSYTTNGITNAISGYWRASLDGVNFITNATWHPTYTNGATDTYAPIANTLKVYYQFQLVTTNPVPIGVYMQPAQ